MAQARERKDHPPGDVDEVTIDLRGGADGSGDSDAVVHVTAAVEEVGQFAAERESVAAEGRDAPTAVITGDHADEIRRIAAEARERREVEAAAAADRVEAVDPALDETAVADAGDGSEPDGDAPEVSGNAMQVGLFEQVPPAALHRSQRVSGKRGVFQSVLYAIRQLLPTRRSSEP